MAATRSSTNSCSRRDLWRVLLAVLLFQMVLIGVAIVLGRDGIAGALFSGAAPTSSCLVRRTANPNRASIQLKPLPIRHTIRCYVIPDELKRRDRGRLVTLIIPEAIPSAWWARALHGQTALMLLWKLRSRPSVVTVNVPYHFDAWLDGDESQALAIEWDSHNGSVGL